MRNTHNRLARLYSPAPRARLNADETIDWTLEPHRPVWLSQASLAVLIGQLLSGETLAAKICRKLQANLSEPWQDALRIQEEEEVRHIELLSRYAQRVESNPQPTVLDSVFAAALDWRGNPAALVILNNIVLESEALALYRTTQIAIGCPLFSAIATHIGKDESRHIRLGRLMIEQALSAVSQDEQIVIFAWIKDLWWKAGRTALAAYGDVDFSSEASHMLESRWQSHQRALSRSGLLTAGVAARL